MRATAARCATPIGSVQHRSLEGATWQLGTRRCTKRRASTMCGFIGSLRVAVVMSSGTRVASVFTAVVTMLTSVVVSVVPLGRSYTSVLPSRSTEPVPSAAMRKS